MSQKEVYELAAGRAGAISFYINRQQEHRPNLLLLHGALGAAEKIIPLMNGLEHCNLLFCDLRGHGRSELAKSGYDPTSMARDLIPAVRGTFREAPVTVIAESFSGIIALEFAKLIPNVKGIVMIDTSFDSARMPFFFKVLGNIYKQQPAQRETIVAFAREFFGYEVEERKLTPRGYADHLKGVHVPIVMITGSRKHDDDPTNEEQGASFDHADLAALEPYKMQFDCIEIPGGGHRLTKTHRDEVVAVIREVIASDFSTVRSSNG